eukprot:scaffold74227_cov48-Phaeocystis_antarctica.AAC.1
MPNPDFILSHRSPLSRLASREVLLCDQGRRRRSAWASSAVRNLWAAAGGPGPRTPRPGARCFS